jgi:hypothetical protein
MACAQYFAIENHRNRPPCTRARTRVDKQLWFLEAHLQRGK